MNQLDLFEERAAIMEYDGGLPRVQAEHEAAKDVAKVAQRLREPFERAGWSAGKAMRFQGRHGAAEVLRCK